MQEHPNISLAKSGLLSLPKVCYAVNGTDHCNPHVHNTVLLNARKTHSFFLLTQVRTNTAMQPTKPIALITMWKALRVFAAVVGRRVHTPHSGLHD